MEKGLMDSMVNDAHHHGYDDDDDLDDNGGADVYLYHHKVRLEQPDSGLTEFWSGDILPTSAAPKSDQ